MAGYTKQSWLDNSTAAPYGPISAARLGVIEQAIYDLKTLTYNVRDYGAKGDNTTDDTAAIQAAIDAATAAYNAGSQPVNTRVYLPAGQYVISTPLVITTTIAFVGNGPQKTVIRPSAGFVGSHAVEVTPSIQMFSVVIDGIHIALNLAPTIVGFYLTNMATQSIVRDCRVSSGGTYGYYIQTSTSIVFERCQAADQTTAGIYVQGDGGMEHSFRECVVTCSTGTMTDGFRLDRTTAADEGGLYFQRCLINAIGGTITYAYHFESAFASDTPCFIFMNECVADNINGTACVLFKKVTVIQVTNSFFTTSAAGSKYSMVFDSARNVIVTGSWLNSGYELLNSPQDILSANNVLAAGGGQGWTVTGSTPTAIAWNGDRLSSGAAGFVDVAATLYAAANTRSFQTSQPIISTNDGGVIDVTPTDGASTRSAYIRLNTRAQFGYSSSVGGILISDNGQSKPLSINLGSGERLNINTSGRLKATGGVQRGLAVPAYSASITPDASLGDWQTITVTNGTAFTVNAPTNPPASTQTQTLTIEVLNSSGGAMGVITWNAAFVFAGLTWANPASTKKRRITFAWNGAAWVAVSIATADY